MKHASSNKKVNMGIMTFNSTSTHTDYIMHTELQLINNILGWSPQGYP